MKYAELRCKSNFSFLQGASHPHELVEEAHRLGYTGLALTDQASVAGVVRGHTAAKELDFSFSVGAEIQLIDGPCIVLWPIDRSGYGRMCQLISRGRTRSEKGTYVIRWRDLCELNQGLIAGLIPYGEVPSNSNQHEGAFCNQAFREVFDDRARTYWVNYIVALTILLYLINCLRSQENLNYLWSQVVMFTTTKREE